MFNRPPRIQQKLTDLEIKITTPRSLPAKPQINWISVVMPLIGGIIVVVLMLLVSKGQSELTYILFLPMILASVAGSVLSYYKQNQDYEKKRSEMIRSFTEEIKGKKQIIEQEKWQRASILTEMDPPPSTCLDMARSKSSRLGERRPEDTDFLSFRIGTGERLSLINVINADTDDHNQDLENAYFQLKELINDAATLKEAPIVIDLKDIGSLGVAGNLQELNQFSWSALTVLLTHHWPSELNIAVFCGLVEVNNWHWLEGVPHRSNIFNKPVIELRNNRTGKKNLLALEEELRRRKNLLQNFSAVSGEGEPILPILIVIFDRISGIYEHAAFSLLLKEGKELGVYGIFLVDQVNEIPGECGAIVSFNEGKISLATTGRKSAPVFDVQPDYISQMQTFEFGQALKQIEWLTPLQRSNPPDQVSLLDLFPFPNLVDLPVATWWDGQQPFGYLRAPIGKLSPTADLVLDLNDSETGHGPHGLIGGMTGSGKSELLKTLILSLALTHHPYDLNFALIDYKGGGAFDEFRLLPHVVGVITDIQNHADYATRVIQSLGGEVRQREKILVDAKDQFRLTAPHIDEYRNHLSVRKPLPRLIIIFDEFAEFQERHEEDAKKLINIARLGRALGIHMILCTQNPMGKSVDPQVRENSNFTICLKVKTQETSKALIGISDAVRLKRGDAFFKVDQPEQFRVAYTGWDYIEAEEIQFRADDSIARDRFYLRERVSESQALVEEIIETSLSLDIPKPPKVWQEPLPEVLTMGELDLIKDPLMPSESDCRKPVSHQSLKIAVGIMDDPVNQKQTAHLLDENLLIVGPSGSGKSTALLTIAFAVASTYSPDKANIYCIDLSGQSPINILAEAGLPHLPKVGGVISVLDNERMNRLFSMLQTEIGTRAEQLLQSVKFERFPDIAVKPLIILLVDGINQQFILGNMGFKDQLDQIVRKGPAVGVYTVITGNLQRDIPDILQADIMRKIILKMTDRVTIQSMIGNLPETYKKKIELGQELNPGRGLINTTPALEFQFALPVNENKSRNYLLEIKDFCEAANQAWHGFRPPDVESLPYLIPVEEIQPILAEDSFLVGKSQETLQSVGFSILHGGPIFMILSTAPGLGKTSALYTCLLQAMTSLDVSRLKLILIDYHSRTLRYFTKVPNLIREESFHSHITKKEDLNTLVKWLNLEIDRRLTEIERRFSEDPDNFEEDSCIRDFGYVLIAIDDYEAFMNTKDSNLLTSCIINGEKVGIRLILTEDVSMLGNDELTRRAKRFGSGILLGGTEGLSYFNNAQAPYSQKTANLKPGRGYIIDKGHIELIQVASTWQEAEDPIEGLKSRIDNYLEGEIANVL